ncbi:MAG TPA: diaminopimelate epimerase [Candidatus Babeliales bacterium]|nr:diaminopimelate epimerase [Candidatus Babeliales bacterium]
MHLTKMHGARNDFIIVDRRMPDSVASRDVREFAIFACDRRSGIGADGCIILEPSEVADVRMRTINSDGSEAEMCGNGVRCAARWLDEAGEGDAVAFETAAGTVRTRIVQRKPHYLVRVAMGRPKVAPIALASVSDATFVEAGNPHVVFFRDDVDDVDLESIAQALQKEPALANGANVHVAARVGGSLRVRHWERGVGLTQACGTGAVACAAAAIERGVVNSPVEVLVPGGRLIVELNPGGDAVLIGPAVRVFDFELHDWQ